ncbi:MAG: sugar phosphate isomerase/epimerase [Chloroflexi bacterium]|nr:sugar phosphate isomerase/epimerase [Chloroflexota bacterium]
MKFGYSTWGMPNVPIDKAMRHLAELGYQGVEITVIPGWITELSTLDRAERKRIVRMAKQYKLAIPAIAAHTSLVETDPEKHACNMTRLKSSIDLAVDWALDGELPIIDTTPGGRPEDWPAILPMLVERTQLLCDYAQTRGVTIGMEPHVGSVLNTPERTVEFLKMVNRSNLGLNFDISHFNVMGYSIEDSVALMAPYSVHTHIKDESGVYPNHQFLIPGEGVFDYVKYLKEMQKAGYTGFISPEISIMVQRRANYDPLAAATQTYNVVAKAFDDAGLDWH